jgi:hypothetical protein
MKEIVLIFFILLFAIFVAIGGNKAQFSSLAKDSLQNLSTKKETNKDHDKSVHIPGYDELPLLPRRPNRKNTHVKFAEVKHQRIFDKETPPTNFVEEGLAKV